jgi:hypothetical protein
MRLKKEQAETMGDHRLGLICTGASSIQVPVTEERASVGPFLLRLSGP